MTTLKFKKDELRRVVEHSANAPSHNMGWESDTPEGPAIILVKDDGIYLMSNGEPADIVKDPTRFVAYARGYDPRDGDVWEKCRAAVGGDDFAETIPLDKTTIDCILGGVELTVRITSNAIELRTKGAVDKNEIRKWLANLLKKNTVGYPTNRHKKLRIWKFGTPPSDWVVLNTMSFEDALATYMRRSV